MSSKFTEKPIHTLTDRVVLVPETYIKRELGDEQVSVSCLSISTFFS